MLYIDVTTEDLRLIAENISGASEGPWHTRLQVMCEEQRRELTSQQLAAILFLAINSEEEVNSSLIDTLYSLAEPALKGLERKFRPIP